MVAVFLRESVVTGRRLLDAEALVLDLEGGPERRVLEGTERGVHVALAAARRLRGLEASPLDEDAGLVGVALPVAIDGRRVGVLAAAWLRDTEAAVTGARRLESLGSLVTAALAAVERPGGVEGELAALREDEQRLRATRESMAEGYVEQDASGAIVACNAAAERILGLQFDQLRGRVSVDPRWHPVRADGTPFPGEEHPAMQVIRTGRPVRDVVMGVVTAEGDRRWILINSHPLGAREGGGAQLAITTFSDITAVHSLAIELQEERLMLSEALQVGRLGAWSFDVPSGLFLFTDEFFGIFRTTSDAEGGALMSPQRYAERFIPPDYREIVAGELEAALRSTGPYRRLLEHPVVFADGERGHIQVSFRVQRDADGRAVRLLGVNQDITERVRRVEEILDERKRLAAILEGTDAGTWAWEIPTGRTFFNERWARMIGYTLAELEPISIATWQRLVHPEDGARSAELLQRHFAGETDRYECECRMRHKDGSWVWVHDRGRVIERDASGAPRWMYGTHLDINARKLAELQRDEAYRSLERQTAIAQELAARAAAANEAKSTFLANMSHEIRTPMNGVLGMTELLLGMDLSPAQSDAARTVYRSAEALLTILNDILDFSKAEAGRIEFEEAPFDVQQLVSDVADLFRGHLAGGAIELRVRVLLGTRVRWRGDAGRLRQVISNLVGNAVKFTHAGHVLIEVSSPADQLRITVADTGIGIPLERQRALFVPFTQGDASTSRRYGGTGLGLAISRHLVEAMGGTLELKSAPGEGTVFTLSVPLAPDLSAQSSGGSGVLRPPTGSEVRSSSRVLLAEDNPINQRVAASMLEQLGCHVTVVANGALAVEAVQQDTFDLVLMDGQMPEMDGVEATMAIRGVEAASGRRVPIVALTASASSDDRQRCLSAGMDDHLAKPTRMSDLRAVLSRWVGRRETGEDSAAD